MREAALKMNESGNVRVLVIHGSRARVETASDRALADNVCGALPRTVSKSPLSLVCMPVLQLLLRGSERVCADWSVAHAQYVAESESMDLRCSGAISSCHEDTWG